MEEGIRNKTFVHIIYTPWTGVGLHGGYRGDDWFKHRIEIFKKYTLKSLLNQTNKNFILWLSFRPEEYENPLTLEIRDAVKSSGLPFCMTFNGLMYWDDKFTDYTLKTKVRNSLMMLWDMWNNKEWNLGFITKVWENKNKTLKERLDNSISVLHNNLERTDFVYLTRLDSDDMLRFDAVDMIQSQPLEYEALRFQNGYIYNVKTGQLAEWNPPTNPPFHTIIFKSEDFYDAQKHLDYYRDFKTHEDIPRVFRSKVLEDGNYCVTHHGKQISTGWDSPPLRRVYQKIKYRGYCYTDNQRNISTRMESRARKIKNVMMGKEFEGEEKINILKGFGI